jgi:hypothetical protein
MNDPNELRLTPDARWHDRGITMEWIAEKSEWIRRDSGSPGAIDNFFDMAGRLMRLCGYDYLLLGPMFFHAVIGLEAMLRVHFKVGPEIPFKELLAKAVREEVITDKVFSNPKPLPDFLIAKIAKPRPPTHAEKLALLLPKLRNDYFHGSYLLAPELLHLALQVREAADALTMPRPPRQ